MVDASRFSVGSALAHRQIMVVPSDIAGRRKIFGTVTRETRDSLVTQVEEVLRYFRSSFDAAPEVPAVARIRLKPNAIAKTHRPLVLLSKASCSVIGGCALGELLISISPSMLARLTDQVRCLESDIGIANLSTIERIEPFTASDALGQLGIEGLSERIQLGEHRLKFRLFEHRDERLNQLLRLAFSDLLEDLGLDEVAELDYSSTLRLFRLERVREWMIEPLSAFVGTRSLSTFPSYSLP